MDLKQLRPLCLAIFLLLVGCNRAATPQLTPTPVQPTVLPTGSSVATADLEASNTQPTNSQTPTVQGDPAAVIGVLISKETGQPLPDAVVRLAEVTRQGDQGMAVMDAGHSPAARTDANGAFKIENVPPAEYVMMLQISEGIYTAAKDDNSKPLTWVVEAGQVVDTGPVAIQTNIP